MAIFRCKMCGGDLEIKEGQAVCTCEFCGTEQTLPRLDSEKKANLYDRANHFRRNNDFDKAMSIYEQILNEDNSDSESYWSLVLCRYGIEYVEDPTTHKRIPTINRAQYTSIYADENYKSALQYASVSQKSVYEQEAKTIDEIQKGILAISEKEEPFDVFICYKETDDAGRRTPDSVLANELYHQLTQEGFKVFFSRITLEDKLGQEYEPYIFAALNSAKVMVVLGTKPEYFKAVWVRNEWSRYLALIKNGAQKMLIPAYKDMDPYDLPDEFSHLQAQDMSKLGFMQDLIRGIKKILDAEKEKQEPPKETVVVQQGSNGNVTALIKRGNMALEDGEWQKADEFFEEVLNQDAECAQAYLGKFLAKIQRSNISDLVDYYDGINCTKLSSETLVACQEDTEHINEMTDKYIVDGYFEEREIRRIYEYYNWNYSSEVAIRTELKKLTLKSINEEKLLVRARKYAKGETKNVINNTIDEITRMLDAHIEQAQNDDIMHIELVKKKYAEFIANADKKVMDNYDNAIKNRENKYQSLIAEYNEAKKSSQMESVKRSFEYMNGYSDSVAYIQRCDEKIEQYRKAEEAEKARLKAKAKRELVIKSVAAISVFIIVIAVIIVVKKVIIPNNYYKKAVALMENEQYEEAMAAFEELDGYKDSDELYQKCYDEYKTYLYENMLAVLMDANVGDIVVFGEYNSNTEWIVLDIQDGKKLLLSKYAVEQKQYNAVNGIVTWESSSIRKWLNNDYIEVAFNEVEYSIIADTKVTNEDNPVYNTSGGNDTMDKVFLLSANEVNYYFQSDKDRILTIEDNTPTWWWLRSPGVSSDTVVCIGSGGTVFYQGNHVVKVNGAVRPALWVDLSE